MHSSASVPSNCGLIDCFLGGCAGVKTTGKGSHDMEYVIRIKAKCESFASVYCHGMNTNSPKEYISLRSGAASNYALIYDYKQPESAKYECERQTGAYSKYSLLRGKESVSI